MKLLLIIVSLLMLPEMGFCYSSAQFDSVTTSEEAQVNLVREKEIQQIKLVLGRRFQEARRPDILLRLAELYVEKYRFAFLKENEIYNRMLKQGMRPSRVDHTRSKEYLSKANDYCKNILKSRVAFDRMDQVFYFLAYNASELGHDAEAAKYYNVVITKYPQSERAYEAYRELGEYYYQKQKYKDAAKYYERAAQKTDVPSYPRTLYKLAWSKFRIRDRSEALRLMKKAIEVSGSEEKFVALKEEALRDLVYFYSDAGRFKEAKDYFADLPGGVEVYIRALNTLSKQYEKTGRYHEALVVNKGLFEEYGATKPAEGLKVLRSDIDLYQKLNEGTKEEEAVQHMVSYVTKNIDAIRDSNPDDDSLGQAKAFIRVRAANIHKDAQKHKSKKLYSRVADLYGLYLNTFLKEPKDDKEFKDRAEVRIYRTDALLAADREDEALPDLEQALLDSYSDKKLRKEAGASRINILIKRLDAKKKSNDSARKQLEEEFLKASAQFEEVFPKDPLVAELKYKKARLEVEKSGPEGLSGDARDALSELIQLFPQKQESRESAQDMVADLLKKKKNEDAVELAQRYLENGTLLSGDKKSELKSYLRSVISREAFQGVKALEGDSEFSKAAQSYEKLAKETTDDEVQFKSLNNAAVNYEKANLPVEAIRVYESIGFKFPTKTNVRDDLKRIAVTEVARSHFATAAQIYMRLSAHPIFKDDEHKMFLRSSYFLYRGIADQSNAALAAQKMQSHYCKNLNDSVCSEIILDYAQSLLSANQPEGALNILKNYSKDSVTANVEIGKLYVKLHELPKASAAYNVAADMGKKYLRKLDPRDRNAAAYAAYVLVESTYQQFMNLKLELPEDHLKKVTQLKLKLAETLASRYQNVVTYGDGEWGIAALAQLSRAFQAFSDEIENAPAPERISKDPNILKQYRDQLKSVAKPMAARAVDYLKQGAKKGLELKLAAPIFIQLTRDLSANMFRDRPPVEFVFEAIPEGIMGKTSTDDAEDLMKDSNSWREQIASELSKNLKSSMRWVELGNIEALSKRYFIAKLAYEQALNLNAKDTSALNNIALVILKNHDYLEAGNALRKASSYAEFDKQIKLNLGKYYLSFHQFSLAEDVLTPIAARSPDDQQVQLAYASSVLGVGKSNAAKKIFDRFKAKKADEFSNWYNAALSMVLAGTEDEKEDGLDLLKDKKSETSNDYQKVITMVVEKNQKGSH